MNKKIIIGIIVAILGGAGAWFLLRDTEKPSQALAQKAVGTHYVGGGQHVVEGTVSLPNPCYALSVTAEKKGSAPEEVLLRFAAAQTADVCVQVIHEASFRISFDAPDNAVLSAVINDVAMALELDQKQLVSIETGKEFWLTMNEERWVEDLKVSFLGINDDSRCPSDVQCIQAGWVTVRLRVGDQEMQLRLPGDATIPNAAVAGSYIITLVEVTPYPTSTEKFEKYNAKLRVEAHDLKG